MDSLIAFQMMLGILANDDGAFTVNPSANASEQPRTCRVRLPQLAHADLTIMPAGARRTCP